MSETPVQKAINDGHHWLSSISSDSQSIGLAQTCRVIRALVEVATELYVADNTAELARKDEIIAELKRGLAEKRGG